MESIPLSGYLLAKASEWHDIQCSSCKCTVPSTYILAQNIAKILWSHIGYSMSYMGLLSPVYCHTPSWQDIRLGSFFLDRILCQVHHVDRNFKLDPANRERHLLPICPISRKYIGLLVTCWSCVDSANRKRHSRHLAFCTETGTYPIPSVTRPCDATRTIRYGISCDCLDKLS